MIESKINQGTSSEREFPKLMVSKMGGKIVLMVANGCGMLIYSLDEDDKIGKYSDDWTMSVFEDFPGSVTLNNA